MSPVRLALAFCRVASLVRPKILPNRVGSVIAADFKPFFGWYCLGGPVAVRRMRMHSDNMGRGAIAAALHRE